MPFCTCQGKTVEATVPSMRWRFGGVCESRVGLYFVGKDAAGGEAPQTLYVVGTRLRAAVGQYSRCEERSVPAPMLAGARCFGEGNTGDELRVQRKGDALVVTAVAVGSQARPREVLRTPAPLEQRLLPEPFRVYVPPPPRPAVVRFDDLKDQKIGAPPGRRTLILDIDRSWYEVGRFDRCAEGTPAPPVLLEARCAEGARTHVFHVTRKGAELIVTDAVDGQPPRERLRAPLRAAELELAPMLRG